MSGNQPILTMESVTKKFPGTLALDSVDLVLYPGEILALVGENGAGKSTMMKILSGTYPFGSYEGTIRINGQEKRFNSSKDAEKAGIAMIYQEITVAGDLTVAENIMLGALPACGNFFVKWKEVRRKAEEVLNTLCRDMDVNQLVRNLSASYQQIVCIARALVRDPQILVLDEPTSPLTELETVELMNIIRCLKDRGIACVYISHKLEEVFSIADRSMVFRDGKKISEYDRDDFVSEKIVEDIIGRKLDIFFPEKTNTVGETFLEFQNISVSDPGNPGKKMLKDVSFSLHQGEVLGLAGLVGSGRSEFLKGVFGAIPMDSGKILMEGRQVRISSPDRAISLGIGLLTEDRKFDGYIPTFSVLHNMTLTIFKKITRNRLISFQIEKQLGARFFKQLKIKSPSLDTNISKLSGGNQQKVLFAKWLLTEPRVLFLDEPTRGVDVGTKAEIYKIINEFSSKGVAIIMVSSELQELIGVCDRILVLNNGSITKSFKGSEADERAILHAAAFNKG